MGTVYAATAVEDVPGLHSGDRVALKIVHPHLLRRPGFFRRFVREAELGRRVHHDNVVRTFFADACMDGTAPAHYLVMEYVEGQTLRKLLAEVGQVPEELCRQIGSGVARALVAIHAAGVVHRDPQSGRRAYDHRADRGPALRSRGRTRAVRVAGSVAPGPSRAPDREHATRSPGRVALAGREPRARATHRDPPPQPEGPRRPAVRDAALGASRHGARWPGRPQVRWQPVLRVRTAAGAARGPVPSAAGRWELAHDRDHARDPTAVVDLRSRERGRPRRRGAQSPRCRRVRRIRVRR